MICPVCSFEFKGEAKAKECSMCVINTNCRFVKCPNCGYEIPAESNVFKKFRHWKNNRKEKAGRLAANDGYSFNLEKPAEGITPLYELKIGQSAEIAYIDPQNENTLHKLLSFGVLPGFQITLKQKFPSIIFNIDYSDFAIDQEIAKDIYVKDSTVS